MSSVANLSTVQDRDADREALQAQMDEYARQGGLVSKLDYAGNLVALAAETPTARPARKSVATPVEGFIEPDTGLRRAKVLPFPKADDRPVVPLTPVEVIPEPEVKLRAKVLPFKAPSAEDPKPSAFKVPAPTDITAALRRLRADAERALARLNAAFPGCDK